MNITKPQDESSPLSLRINVFVDDHWNRLKREQILPWLHLSSPGLKCKDFYDKEISYSGIAFEGSPQLVFWGGYIEPFLRNIIDLTFDQAVSLCREKDEALRPALTAVETNLRRLIRDAYNQMADVDRRLRANGYPDKLSLRSVDSEVNAMYLYVIEKIKSELAMWKPKPRLTRFYERHPLWFWLTTTGISVVSLIRTFK